MRRLFLYACAVIAILAVVLIVTSQPASPEEARQMADESGPITTRVPWRECAYREECYSWGGQVQEWHKAFAPVLLILAFLTVVVFVKRLPK